jgi:hypothetical protein
MKFAKKMILVPAGRPEPSTQHLSELDKQMADVLKNNQLSDYEKIAKYNYILSRNKLIDSNIKDNLKLIENDENDKLREIIRDEINKLTTTIAYNSSLKNIKTETVKTSPNDNTSHKNIKTEMINASPIASNTSSYSRNSLDDILNSTINTSNQSDNEEMDITQNVQQKDHNNIFRNINTFKIPSSNIKIPQWHTILNSTTPIAKRLRSTKRKKPY